MFKSANHGRTGAKLLFSKIGPDTINADLVVYVADSTYYAACNGDLDFQTFTGAYVFFDLAQHFRYAIYVDSGAVLGGTDSLLINPVLSTQDRQQDCEHYSIQYQVKCEVAQASVECLNWHEISIWVCNDELGSAGPGGGAGSGGGGSGGGSTGTGGGTGSGGTGTNTYPIYWLLFTGGLPISYFEEHQEELPAGFDLATFIQLNEIVQELDFTNEEKELLEWLLARPNLTPIIHSVLIGRAHTNPEGYAAWLKEVLAFSVAHGLTEGQFEFLILNGQVYAQVKMLTEKVGLTPLRVSWLVDHSDVSSTFAQWLTEFDHHAGDIGLIQRVLDFRMNNDENDLSAAQNFLAAELETILSTYNLSLPGNQSAWTPDYWEIVWEVLKTVVPELIPGLDTAIELKNAIESANNGDWWQSSWHFAGAILTLSPWDKIKDSYKFAKALGRANRWFDLIKRCSGYSDELARGLRNILNKELNNPHIFRKASGHLPDLNPAITAAGGTDNLLFDVYKKVHDDDLAAGLQVGQGARLINFHMHGIDMQGYVIRYLDPDNSGAIRLEVSDFWKKIP